MSFEIVTSPKNGVTVSLAGHTVFAGHILCVTFDAIQQDSVAYNSLVTEMQREQYRTDLKYQSPSRSGRFKDMCNMADTLQANLEGRKVLRRPIFVFEGSSIVSACKKAINDKLGDLVSRLHSFVSVLEKKSSTSPTI